MTKKNLSEISTGTRVEKELEPLHDLMKTYSNSPLQKVIDTYHASPTAKALEILNMPNHRTAIEAFRCSSMFTTTEILRKEVIAGQGNYSNYVKLSESQTSILKNPSWLAAQKEIAGIRGSILANVSGGQTKFDAITGYKSLIANSSSLNNIVKEPKLPWADLAQANQWASSLTKMSHQSLASLYPGLSSASALNDIIKIANTVSAVSGGVSMSTALGFSGGFNVTLESTCLKLSAFAGSSSVFGAAAPITSSAYHNLFGAWRTRPDLPEPFWSTPQIRHRMYEEANVDHGLVDASLNTALEVVIESGLAGGFREQETAVAIISVGTVAVSIRSSDTRQDAYKVLGIFEQQLRNFIGQKLSEKAGQDWFKQRVEGSILVKAKETRVAAVKRGETLQPLINYTDMGELNSIVCARNNWDDVFGPVFINRSRFEHDILTLIAGRRPTAHYRTLDAVRLVELLCVIDRLTKQMDNDGAWQRGIESDQ